MPQIRWKLFMITYGPDSSSAVEVKIPERSRRNFRMSSDLKFESSGIRGVRKLAVIKIFDDLSKHSELTDTDCLRLGREMNGRKVKN